MDSFSTKRPIIARLLHYIIVPDRAIAGIVAFLLTTAALGNPVINNVASGNVSVQQTSSTTTVNQASQKAIINWHSFNIGRQEATHFNQPAGGITFNRISPNQGASSIYGTLTATGQIILVNPAGIYFGPSAYVNVGGLIATTHNMTDQNFLNGNYQFSRVSPFSGSVINEGTIIARNGLVALVAPSVVNNGLIQANMGKVILASGDAFTVSFDGNGLVNFAITQPTSSPGVDQNGNALRVGVKNTGSLIADGGTVLVTAQAAAGVLDTAIDMQGVAQARSVQEHNGEIILSADTDTANDNVVRVAGTLDASGNNAGEKGGNINIASKYILLDDGAKLLASGDQGGGNIFVGGNFHGTGPLPNAIAVVMRNASINADAITNGNGGQIALWSDNFTNVYNSSISAQGGTLSGNGGFIETSSHNILNTANIFVSTKAPHGSVGEWLLDPFNVTISTSATANESFGSGTYTPTATGANILNTDLQNNLANGNVTVSTINGGGLEAGILTVSAPITWASSSALTLIAINMSLNAAITAPYGTLNLQVGGAIVPNSSGAINVGTFNLQQGTWSQIGGTIANFYASNFLLANGVSSPGGTAAFYRVAGGSGTTGDPYTIFDVYGLQGAASLIGTSFKLINNIDASGTVNWGYAAGSTNTGFVPIGYYNYGAGNPSNATNATAYAGSFNGNGYVINNLFVNQNDTTNAGYLGYEGGLFGAITSGSSITNVGLNNATVYGSSSIGGLVGIVVNPASTTVTLNNNWVTGYVSSTPTNVSGAGYLAAGGQIGSIVSAGTVNVGNTTGPLAAGYSTATVISGGATGGFIGWTNNTGGGSINFVQAYASGNVNSVNGGGFLGAFGGTTAGTFSNVYWDTQTTGKATASLSGALTGVTGITTANALLSGTYSGWSISSTPGSSLPANQWFIFSGYTRPLLISSLNTSTYSVGSPEQLQLMGAALGQSYSLSNNIDLTSVMNNKSSEWATNAGMNSGVGFVPIGYSNAHSINPASATTEFSGSINGNNYAINGLYINGYVSPGNYGDAGLIGATYVSSGTQTIQNLNLTNVNITAASSGNANASAGGLIAFTTGIGGTTNVNNISVIGSITGGSTTTYLGGLIGSAITANASGTPGASGSTFIITNSYTATSLTPGGASLTGGLIGNVVNFASSGSVQISKTYASGPISSGGTTGGLIGGVSVGTPSYSNNYWDTQSTGQSTTAGTATGLTTSQMMVSSNFSGWSISNTPGSSKPGTTWFLFEGFTRPMLLTELPTASANAGSGYITIATPHQLQLAGSTLGSNYLQQSNIDLSIVNGNTAEVWGGRTTANAGFFPIGYDNTSVNGSTAVGTEFTGIYNGQGYVINNLYQNMTSEDSTYNNDTAGLFGGVAGNAALLNIGLPNANVNGYADNGILAGNVIGTGNMVIANNFSTGSINSNINASGYNASGGLIGVILPSGSLIVNNNYTTAAVSGVSGTFDNIGGFVGFVQGGTITLSNNYSTGSVTLAGVVQTARGFAGTANGGGTVSYSNNYWDNQTGPTTSADQSGAVSGVTGRSTSTLTTFDTTAAGYNGWSLTNTPSTTAATPAGYVWFMYDGSGKTRPMLLIFNKSSVSSPEQLQLMGAALQGNYTLSNNIDLTTPLSNLANVWATNRSTPSGAGFVPISGNSSSTQAFTGSFNGANYTISNLYENSSLVINMGLFNNLNNAYVYNLTLANPTISNTTSSAFSMGTLAGYTSGTTYITNVLVSDPSVTFSGASSGIWAGGLIGNVTSSSTVLSQSAVEGGFVNINITGSPTIQTYFGGLIGLSSGTISNSYSTANVIETGAIGTPTTNLNVGGLIGRLSGGTVTNSYAAGYVTASGGTSIGGLVGNNTGGTFTASYYNNQTSGQGATGVGSGTSTNVSGLSITQMMNSSNFSGWNFTSPWSIISGASYPYLNTIYVSTPRAISAYTPAGANSTVRLAVNGTIIDTGYSGAVNTGQTFAYFIEKNGTIADSNNLLMYIDSGATLSNYVTLAPTSGGSISPLTMNTSTVTLDSSYGGVSNATLSTAKGSLSDSDILYSVSSNNLTVTANNDFNVTGANTYSPGGNVTTSGTGKYTIAANMSLASTYIFSSASALNTITGNISGAGGFTIARSGGVSGTTTLSGTNTYSGTTTIDSSVLKNGASNTLPSGTTVHFMGSGLGTYNVNGFTQTITNITEAAIDSGDTINLGSGGTLTLSNASGTVGTYYTGSGTLNKQGTGNYTLDNINGSGYLDFIGTANITAGTLTLSNGAGSTADVNVSSGATLSVTTNNTSIGTLSGAGNVTVSSSGFNFSIGSSTSGDFSGVLAGTTTNIFKEGTGVQTFSGLNTYSGKTTIDNGTLSINTIANVSGGSSSIGAPTTAGNGTIDIAGAGILKYTGSGHSSNRVINLLGSGATLDASGSGTLTLSGGITGNTFNLVLTGTGTGTESGAIATTSGTVTKSLGGNWTLSGTNTYTGTTTINAGILTLGSATALSSSSGNVTVASGGELDINPDITMTTSPTLTLNGSGTNAALWGVAGGSTGISGWNGAITLGSAASIGSASAATLNLAVGSTINNGGFLLTFNNAGSVNSTNAISGSGGLTMSGSGTTALNFNGVNSSYTGTTTVSNGTLMYLSIANSGSNSTLGAPTTNSTIQVSGGATLLYTGSGSSSNRVINIGSGGAILSTNGGSGALTLSGNITGNGNSLTLTGPASGANSQTISGVISGSGTTVTKSSTGTWILSGVNTYTGATTINGGTLSISSIANGGSASNIGQSTNAAANLVLGGGTLQYTGSGAASTDRNFTLTAATTGTFDISSATGNLTISGAAASTSGALIKSGSGTLTLSGANAYTGATTINAGTLSVSSIANGGVASNIGQSTNAAANLVLGGGTLQYTGSGSTSTDRNFTLTAATTGTFNISSATGNLTISGAAASTSGALTKSGSGTLTLSGANAYTGTTTISAGTLALSGSGALGTTASGTTIASGATLSLTGATVGAEALSITGTGVGGNGALLNVSGSSTYGGTLTLAGATTIGSSAGTLTLNNATAITNGSNDVTFTGAGDHSVSGIIGSGAGGVIMNGSGTLTLGGVNTYTGATTVNAGTLSINADSRLGTAPGVATPGSLVLNGGTLLLTSSFTINSNRGITLGASGGTISTTTGEPIYNGIIAGSGSLTKTGSSGGFFLGGVNTYTGATIVNSGPMELGVANAIDNSSSITINNDGFIDFTFAGTFGNTNTINLNTNSASNALAFLNGSAQVFTNPINLMTTSILSNTGSSVTLSGQITGAGGLTTTGGSPFTISNSNNTYTGTTTVNNGTLFIGNSGALNGTSDTVVTFAGSLIMNFGSGTLGNSNQIALNCTFCGSNGGLALFGSGTTLNNPIVLGADMTISGTGTLTNQISGGFNLTISSGTITFSGTNTYTGSTTLSGGNLVLASTGALNGSTGSLTVPSGRSLTMSFSNGTLGNTNTIILNGSGSGSGALIFSGTNATLSNAVTLASDTTIGGTGSGIINGAITGAFNLTKAGNGSLQLGSTSNNYGGNTNINGGTLRLGASNVIPDGSTVFITNGSGIGFDLNNNSETIGTLSTTSGAGLTTITLGSGTLTIVQGSDSSYTGTISGTGGSIIKAGANNLSLGNNTFTGGLTLNAGTITVGANSSLGTGTLTYNGGTLANGTSGVTLANNVTLNASIDVNNSNSLTLSGIINDGASSFGLIKNGSASLTLSGNNTFDGGVTLNAGTLTVGNNNALGTGILTYNAGTLASSTSTTLANNVTLNASLAINSTNALTLNGVIDDGASSFGLTKSGTGNLTLAGNNTFDGGVTFSAGTLTVGNNNALGTGALIYNGGTLASSGSVTLANDVTLNATLVYSSTNNLTLNGIINDGASSFGLTKSGSGNLTLAGNNTFDGGVTLSAGTLTVGNNNALGTGTLVYNAGTFASSSSVTLANNVTLNATMGVNSNNDLALNGIVNDGASSFGLTKSGSGNLTLNGNNTFDGGVTLSAGTLTVGNNNALGTGTFTYNAGTFASSSSVTLANNITLNATLGINSSNDMTLNGIINDAASSFGLTKNGSGNLTLAGNNTFDGGVTLSAGTLTVGHNNALGTGALTYNAGTFASSTSVTLANNVTLNAALGINSNNDMTLNGTINDSASSFGLTKSGSGNLTLAGNNTFDGGVTLSAGTLTVGHNNALGTGALTYNAGTFASSTSVTLANNVTLNATLGINSSNAMTLNGIINDGASSFGVTKSGSANLTLAGNNTFDGGVTLSAGTLTVGHNNALGTGTFTYQNGTFAAGTSGINIANAIDLQNNLALSGSNDFTLSGAIGETGGARSLIKTGSSNLTLAGTSNFTGGVTLNGGTLTANASASLGTGTFTYQSGTFTAGTAGINIANAIDLQNNLALSGSNDFTLSGAIGETGGARSLIKTGSSNLTLAGTSNFTGGVTLNGGTLTANASASLGTGTFTYQSGTFTAGTAGINIANVVDLQSDLTLGGTNNFTLSGAIGETGGARSLIQAGSNNLTVTGNNTFTGGATLNSGTLTVGNNNALGTGTLTFNGGTLAAGVGGFTISNDYVLGSSAAIGGSNNLTLSGNSTLVSTNILTVSNSANTTLSGVLDGSGLLIKLGSGTLTLSGANTYTGNTSVAAGTLQLGASSVLDDANSVSVSSGATFSLNGFNETIGTVSGAGNVSLGSNTLTLNNNTNTSFSGALSSAVAGTLKLQGSAIFTISSNNAGFAGNTLLTSGTLNIANNGALGTSTLALNGGTLTSNNNSIAINNNFTVGGSAAIGGTNNITLNGGGTLNSGTLSINNSGTTTLNGALAGSGALTINNGTLTLTNNNTPYTGTVTMAGGIVQANNATDPLGAGNLLFNGGALAVGQTTTFDNNVTINNNSTLSGSNDMIFNSSVTLNNTLNITNSANTTFISSIVGSGGISIAGDTTFAATNTYGGGTNINNATLTINNANIGNSALTLNNATIAVSGVVGAANGAITLSSGTNNTLQAGGGSTLTLGGNINGAGNLTLQGGGNMVMNGSIGNSTAITSLTTSTAAAFANSVTTNNAQAYGAAVTLTGNATFTSNNSTIAFSNTLNGAFNLTLSSSGIKSFAGIVGGVAELNSLTVNGGGLTIAGGAVSTLGNQTYNTNVNLSADAVLASTAAGNVTLALNNGVSGNNNLTLQSAAAANANFVLSGSLVANNITINGGAIGNNTFSVNSTNNQSWNINSANGGTLAGISGVGGTFAFNNIRSLNGGNNNDSFALNGGTLSGSINGAGGNNSLIADNVSNTWNLSGTNNGTVTGISGIFSNIQNLTGGTANNNFVFDDGAAITGNINAGSLSSATTFNFSAYSTPVYATLIGGIFNGTMKNNNGNAIANYTNVNNLIGNVATNNVIYLPSGKHLSNVTFNDAPTNRQGFIGDPLNFTYFTVIDTTPPPPPPPEPTNTTTNVASIIQQPTTNANNSANSPTSTTPSWVVTNTSLNQNLTALTTAISEQYNTDLSKVQISPYCYSTGN